MIKERFTTHANNFEVHKYVTISTNADDRKQAQLLLQDIGVSLGTQFQESDITFKEMNGLDRLKVFSELLRDNPYVNFDYRGKLLYLVCQRNHLLLQTGLNFRKNGWL